MTATNAKNKRRHILAWGAGLAGLWLLQGCGATEKTIFPERHEHADSISSFYISADEKSLVVFGKHHHYIFALPPELHQVLKAPLRKSVMPNNFRFWVDSEQRISGEYVLTIPDDADPEDIKSAPALGFKPDYRKTLAMEGRLVGKRYDSTGFTAPAGVQNFLRSYSATIVEPPSAGEQMARKLATPLTTAADGVLLLFAIPLLAVAFVCGGTGTCR